jgi:N-glycosylase/DNA lyase
VATFPEDGPLRLAVQKHWGLRILRQEPWETLASFIASSTKQIAQIRQIVKLVAQRLGQGGAFPDVETVARAELPVLLGCKLGFRAKYLQSAARMIDSGQVRLFDLAGWEYERALEELQKIPGVGEKIANCALLFGCGFHQAFPVDVWVRRSIKRLYFPRRRATPRQLREFTRSHFGPYAGWAQQYLFYAERMRQTVPSQLTTCGTEQ